ncbi:cAMP-binding proteins - catabolite gene activator and regulatory subunit of cAMP-dependent protein kinases [hydrothermal vent metagenome]|uniref:cAMP-binding proteins - catabolite gene activator and regulatory subunit of cAMP-dependent protein kinases n=1 Tax=hydrothermal vent metagenome TaxID=652676 RepID=A0A3B0WY80_9ZZZZ
MNNSHIKNFQTFIEQHVSLKPKDFNIILNIFRLKKYKNNTHIIEPVEENNSIFFIISGLVRYYYLTEDGKEWNRAFLSEKMMSTSFSKGAGWIDPYGIQAIEDTSVLIAEFSDFQGLFEDNPMIERLQHKLTESILVKKMNRERSFLQSSAKNRYSDFIKQYPEVFHRITKYHLASYLGITEASLSRLRSNSI